jgi:ketosteroid isomerase-like protein
VKYGAFHAWARRDTAGVTDRAGDVVRTVVGNWSRGDFMTDADLLDEHVVFVLDASFPDAGTYYGAAALRDYTRGLIEPWDRLTIELEEQVENGDTVFTTVKQSGTGISSGVPAELTYFVVWTVRAGKVIRFDNFRDREEALKAAGLP